MQRLSAQSSEFSRKIHAAKIYALLRSVMLLEAHLEIFALQPKAESEEDSDDEGSNSDDEVDQDVTEE